MYRYVDLITFAVIFVGIVIAHKAFNIHTHELIGATIREFKQLFAGKFTTGSVNAIGLIFLLAFGFFIFAEHLIGQLISLAVWLLGDRKGPEYVEAVSAYTYFVTFAVVAVLSAFFTLARETHK